MNIKATKNKLSIIFYLRNFRNFFYLIFIRVEIISLKLVRLQFTGSRCCDVNVYKKFPWY